MPDVIELDDYNFDQTVLQGKKVALIDFWAPWCGPCKVLGPIIEEVAKEIKDTASVGKMNVDENPIISSRYKIMSIPTILVFKDGKIIDQVIGVQSKDALIKRLQSAINS